jgi:UDP-N-acetylglucosamine--N-acetylmuramyl-(pentapeptide) pyrophosphoryl-undecaprenol N-acetylglucosamine transferase
MLSKVKNRYKELAIEADVSAFIGDMVAAYQWADLVICRAGAMTISEVAAMGVPAIFIPLPNAIDDHQTANAHYLTDAGAGMILKQSELTPVSLAAYIQESRHKLTGMKVAALTCARLDATEIVAAYCMAEAGL